MIVPGYRALTLNLDLGEMALVPAGGILDIGGTTGPTFTVGGKPLLFADGTPTGPDSVSVIDLQGAYNNSNNGNINLTFGKNFSVTSLNQKVFSIDYATGKVTINGDLDVWGSSVRIEGTAYNLDEVAIAPPKGDAVPLSVIPLPGVTFSTDLFQIFKNDTTKSVWVDKDGILHAQPDIVVGNESVTTWINNLADHLLKDTLPKHDAVQIAVDPIAFTKIVGNDVQTVLEDIDKKLGIGSGSSNAACYVHHQVTKAQSWPVLHNLNNDSVICVIYDANGNQVLPAEMIIIDMNNVLISFGAAVENGKAVIISVGGNESSVSTKYLHHQETLSQEWTIVHNLNSQAPHIVDLKCYIDIDGTVKDFFPSDITYIDNNTVKVILSSLHTGYVKISL